METIWRQISHENLYVQCKLQGRPLISGRLQGSTLELEIGSLFLCVQCQWRSIDVHQSALLIVYTF